MRLFFRTVTAVFLTMQVQAAPTLTDFWKGKAAWIKDVDRIGADFGFHFLSIIPQKRELWAYYINNYTGADGKLKMTIGRARGKDAGQPGAARAVRDGLMPIRGWSPTLPTVAQVNAMPPKFVVVTTTGSATPVRAPEL